MFNFFKKGKNTVSSSNDKSNIDDTLEKSTNIELDISHTEIEIENEQYGDKLMINKDENQSDVDFNVNKLNTGTTMSNSDEVMSNAIDFTTASTQDPIILQGYIHKRGGRRNSAYRRRWCKLSEDGWVFYFQTKDTNVASGTFNLIDASINILPTKSNEIEIITPYRIWQFKFESQIDMDTWVSSLQKVCDEYEDANRRSSGIG